MKIPTGIIGRVLHGSSSYCQLRILRQLTSSCLKGDNSKLTESDGSIHPDKPENNGSVETNAMKDYREHIPIMTEEVLHYLNPQNQQLYVDMTFGGGGHTRSILEKAPDAKLVCVDRDPTAISLAEELASTKSPGQIMPCHSKFSLVYTHLHDMGIKPGTVDGFLFDVGPSSMQFDQIQRGFALSKDGPLDMRMDQSSNNSDPTAADVVNSLDENELGLIIRKYSGEKNAKKIAHAIVETRAAFGKITRTQQLADIVASVFPEHIQYHKKDKLKRPAHVATQTFMALRIFVNNELNEFNNGLEIAYHYLKPNGRCVTLTFHSLEDRIAKRHFHEIDLDAKPNMSIRDIKYERSSMSEIEKVAEKKWTPFKKKIIVPSEEECARNPRARSAKLRAAVKNVI